MNADAAIFGFGGASWKEEALLHDGSKIIVKRSQSYAYFSDLRLWRDFNQDGISQEDELFSLDSQHIAALKVGKTEHTQTLPNSNQLGDLGGHIRTDGSGGTLGAVITTLQRSNKAKLTLLVVGNKRTAVAANDATYSGVFARASA